MSTIELNGVDFGWIDTRYASARDAGMSNWRPVCGNCGRFQALDWEPHYVRGDRQVDQRGVSTTSAGTMTITAIDTTGKRATAAATLCEDGTWLAHIDGAPAFMHEAATADEAIEGVRRAWEHVQRNRG